METAGTPTTETVESRAHLQQLLGRAPLLSGLDDEVLRDLVDACDLVDVPGGTRLLCAGQRLDALLAVVHGSLRVVGRSGDAAQTVREFYRGDTVGVMGLLSARPFPVDLYAVRDSTLLRLPRARWLALAAKHPALLVALAQLMGERAFDVLEASVGPRRPATTARAGNLALLSMSNAPAVRDVVSLLLRALEAERPLTRVSAALVDETFGAGTAASATVDAALTAWLSQLEADADVVVYECEPRQPAWAARCLRQSDRVVIVASASDTGAIDLRGWLERLGRSGGLTRPIDLVLVHPPSTHLPSQTWRWLDVPDLRAIHHVRHGGDVARAARRIVGRPTGLVLSGGGARGIAHVGVIAAITEAGIPIDYVCGTSMGAIFAAGLALGFDVDRIREEVGELFGSPFALYDLTLPISSLLAGKKLDRVLQGQYGDAAIEDLWTPFFCVSTDLAQAKMVVHERGCLWQSVRASCSIPGIFPPLPLDGGTLVDGGLVDNLPLDLMLERCSGPVIAVDVFPYGDSGFVEPRNAVTRLLRRWRTRWRGEPASPPLFDILMRSTLVGSKVRQQGAMSRAEQVLYLEPPVASFGMLQWRAHRELFEAGYRYARHELSQRREEFPH